MTGLTSDLVASTITNLIKILLKASLLGSDVLMSVSKVLEILVVDVHPEKRLKHEMERLSLPMVGPTGSTKTLFQMLQALKLISTISTGQACVTHNDELLQSFLESSFQSLQNKVNVEIESLNILEDGESKQEVEDEKESKINLRGLIRQIMNALSPGVARDTCNSLMDRYNMGGITLSSYHQKHGGLLNTSEEKTYVRHYTFKYIDDVRGLIDKFIDEMYESYLTYLNGRGEDPLLKFNEALGTSLTPKAKELHRYLIEGIAHKLAEKYNITRASLFHSPRISFNSEGFLEQYSISNGIKPTEMKEGQTQIEARLSEVNESRRLREENRRRQPQESGHRIR